MKNVIVLSIFLIYLTACSSNETKIVADNTANVAAIQATPKEKSKISAIQVMEAFKKANLPMSNEITYTEETDLNHLLNRPNQYVEKICWKDNRMKAETSDKTNATIEVFNNQEDLDKRKKYVEAVTGSMSALSQYHYAHKNVYLRLNHELLPKQAAEYEKLLKGL